MKGRVFREVGSNAGAKEGNFVFRGLNEWDEGDTVEAVYLGTKTKNKYKKNNHHFLVEASNFDKKLVGKELVISAGILDFKLKEVSEDEVIQLEYLGKETMSKGEWAGSKAHNVKISILADNGGEGDDL